MRGLITILCFIALNACSTWKYVSSKHQNAEELGLAGHPRKVITYRYQQDGRLFIKSTDSFNADGYRTQKQLEIHNPGKPVRYDTSYWTFDQNNFLTSELLNNQKTGYVNNRHGRVKKKYFYRHPDSLAQLTTYKYKPGHRKIILKSYNTDGSLYSTGISSYDKKDHIIYSKFFIPGYNALEETWWERDEQGRKILSKLKSNDINDTLYTYFTYDPDGKLSRTRYVDQDKKIKIKKFTYHLDSLGNWIERTQEVNGYKIKERKEIEYYK